MTSRRLAIAFAALFFMAAPAAAQDPWVLDDSINALTQRERKDLETLPGKLVNLPKDVIEDLLKEEGKHLESMFQDELDKFADEAKALLKANGPRRLWSTLKVTLKKLGILSKRVLAIAYKEELKRLYGFEDRIVDKLIAGALKRIIVDRVARFKTTRLDAIKLNETLNGPTRRYGWKTGTMGGMGSSHRALPDLVLLAKQDNFVRTLFEKEIKSDLGTMKLTAAKVEGLYKAKVGKLSIKDDFGRVHEGLGARFTAKASFVATRVDITSRRFELMKKGNFGISTMILARVLDATTNAEIDSTTILSTDGLYMANSVKAGATVSTSVRMPVTFNLKLLKVKVTPYAEAHAGVGAEAHFNIEFEWDGRVAIDVGSALSLGAGFGAGLIIEIEAGELIKRVLERVERRFIGIVRPIFDEIRGISEKGPAFESGKMVVEIADLEQKWAEPGATAPGSWETSDPATIARRYAPIFYQRVRYFPSDLIRRVDFDGDFQGTNNWNNSSSGGRKGWVYYDVKETETHFFVNYYWFYARRESRALPPLRYMTRHENDGAGVTVVIAKKAKRGHAVRAILTGDGDRMRAFGDRGRRHWKSNNERDASMRFGGEVRFVNEADHPYFDRERVHPQIFVSAGSHVPSGYNGRDDRDGFVGKGGVVYYPTGTAESPESQRDLMVGYGLLPLSDLMKRAQDPASRGKLFGKGSVTPSGSRVALPRAFRGKKGPDDMAILPWAYSHAASATEMNSSDGEDYDLIEPGELYADPAKVISSLWKVDEPFSQRYLRNDIRGLSPRGSGPARAPAGPVRTPGVVGEMERNR